MSQQIPLIITQVTQQPVKALRERAEEFGVRSLTYQELLALITERPAAPIVASFKSPAALCRATSTDIQMVVTQAGAKRLLAAIELARRMSMSVLDERPVLSSPADVANLLMFDLQGKDQEYLYVIHVDTRNRMIGNPVEVYHGSLNTSLIRIGEVFREAIKLNAAGIIVVHNHPSGDPSPSPEDVAVTRVIRETGKMIDIELLDHVVIGHGRFVSLKERGLAF